MKTAAMIAKPAIERFVALARLLRKEDGDYSTSSKGWTTGREQTRSLAFRSPLTGLEPNAASGARLTLRSPTGEPVGSYNERLGRSGRPERAHGAPGMPIHKGAAVTQLSLDQVRPPIAKLEHLDLAPTILAVQRGRYAKLLPVEFCLWFRFEEPLPPTHGTDLRISARAQSRARSEHAGLR
jgi:hypothetical protein